MTKKNRFLPLVAILVAVPLALAACSSDTTTQDQTGDGGTLNIGIHVEPTDWSPSRIQTILFPFTKQIYESLITYDDELNPSPALAAEWQIDDNQAGVVVTLRDDVLFHGGDPMTAEAVAANLDFFADPDTGQQLNGPMSVVDSWEVVDETTLDITFAHPISELQITDLLQSWTIGDPAAFDDSSRGEGTGPYRFVEWMPGERIVLERNNDYWGDAPAYDELFYRVFGDMDSLIAGFESDVVDLVVDAPPLDAKRLESDNTVLVGTQGALIDQWRINPTAAPFDNADVRQAINYATDRDSIVEALYQGYSEPTALPYSQSSLGFDEELNKSLQYDLDRAREHIEKSGLSESELTGSVMVNSANARTSQAAQILQDSLAKIGFTLELDVKDNAAYTENTLSGNFSMIFSALGNGQKYPTQITTNSIYRLENNPVSALEVFPDYEPAVQAANSAVTKAEQEEALAQLNEVLVESMWAPTVGYLPTLWIISPEVSGVDRNVDNMLLLGGAGPAN